MRAYSSDWAAFEAWCASKGLTALPATPATVALCISDMAATLKPATLQRRLADISKAHQAARYDSPCAMRHAVVAEVWQGIKRTHGTTQTAKAAATTEVLRSMIGALPDSPSGIRDRALLLVGFAGAFRRSELVALNVEDIAEVEAGLIITIRRSKTDQDGQGRKVAIPFGSLLETCPVRSLRAWLRLASIEAGAIFRSIDRHGHMHDRMTDHSVALIVKRLVMAAGLDPAKFSGHSLRAGLVTSAASAGVSEASIMRKTGHRSVAMVRRYVTDVNLFRDDAAARVGL